MHQTGGFLGQDALGFRLCLPLALSAASISLMRATGRKVKNEGTLRRRHPAVFSQNW